MDSRIPINVESDTLKSLIHSQFLLSEHLATRAKQAEEIISSFDDQASADFNEALDKFSEAFLNLMTVFTEHTKDDLRLISQQFEFLQNMAVALKKGTITIDDALGNSRNFFAQEVIREHIEMLIPKKKTRETLKGGGNKNGVRDVLAKINNVSASTISNRLRDKNETSIPDSMNQAPPILQGSQSIIRDYIFHLYS